MNKFEISLVNSCHKKGLSVTILNSDLVQIILSRTCDGLKDVLGASRTSVTYPRLLLKCFYDLGVRDGEDPGARLIGEFDHLKRSS